MAEEKLKNPHGLTLNRKDNKFTLTWKQGNNYTDQQIAYNVEYQRGNIYYADIGVNNITSINKNANHYTLTINTNNYIPAGSKILKRITIWVRGKFKGHWTEWKYKDFEVNRPARKPTVGFALVQRNKGTFSWSCGDEGNTRPISHLQRQSVLVKDCPSDYKVESLWSNKEINVTATAMSDSWTKAEDSAQLAGKSYTRLFRIRAIGLGGYGDWSYSKHVYAKPKAANNVTASVTKDEEANTMMCSMTWKTPANAMYPIDEIIPQYLIDVPDEDLECPDSNDWVSRPAMANTSGKEADIFSIDGLIGNDKCLFARVLTRHDGTNEETASLPVLASGDGIGMLKSPTVGTPELGTNAVTCTATNNSDVVGSVLYMWYVDKNGRPYSLGEQTVSNIYPIPDLANKIPIKIGAQARATGNGKTMLSATVWSTGDAPTAPTTFTLGQSATVKNTVTVSWTWDWNLADGCEVSWSTHSDAWDSTDEPETYIVTKMKSSMLNISDVEAGVPLYVRLRYTKGAEGEEVYSPYSDTESITISAVPQVPVLQVNKDIFVKGEPIVCSWVYVTNDGTEQARAEVAEVINNAIQTPYLATVESEQTVTIPNNWNTDTQHSLAVRVFSESGRESEWSVPYTISIAEELTCTISNTSLVSSSGIISSDIYDGLLLRELPLSVTVTGAGNGMTTLNIVRAESYRIARPDGNDFFGYEDEIVYSKTYEGEAAQTITLDDLTFGGRFDDGARYRIEASVSDSLGQKAVATPIEFLVNWDIQAVDPTGSVLIDNGIAKITVTRPSEITSDTDHDDDTIDIYRLSSDAPKLIYKGAHYADVIVDPYPTIGENGGYMLVLNTVYGDSIVPATANVGEHTAWTEIYPQTSFTSDKDIIDFNGERIYLYYNVDVSNNWSKDTNVTKYLGGSIVCDYKKGVQRSGAVSTVAITLLDNEMILAMRRLLNYLGDVHIRTKDGSSFTADIQGSEDNPHNKAGTIRSFSLNVTECEPTQLDGLTLGEWQNVMG